MSQLITEKDNERFAANTADMTQDDFFVIAILEMCTDPELSKRFHEAKTDELTWGKLREVAETYERATASDMRAMMVNSNNRFGKRSQGTSIKTCYLQHPLIHSLMTYDTQYNNREIEYIEHNYSSDASSL